MALKLELLAELDALSEGENSDLLGDLVGMFEENVTSLTRAMRDAVVNRNAKGIQRAAHTLKGSAGGLGLERTAEICLKLEKKARYAQFRGCEKVIDKAEKELKENIVLLRDYLLTRKVG
jgi:HPt (histidine-containing phosphotransfer) domain-containing protein